ncbi:MAG: hypothetical protein Q9167_003656 [Letrouitia subvulpina]
MELLLHENRKKEEPQAGHSSDPEDYYRVDRKSSRVEPSIAEEPASPTKAPKKPTEIPLKSMSLHSKEQSETSSPRQSKDSDHSQKIDYDELNKDFRKVYRENREQALELRDLKKKNAQLIEAVRLLEKSEPRIHKEMILPDRRSLFEHIRLLEDHIDYLKSQMDKSKHHMESLTFQTREANEEKVALEAKILNLERQNQRLNNDLTECRDDIMRLQPPSQIPDSKIAEQFSNLYQEIASWVDDKCEDPQMMDSQLGNLYANKDSPDLLKTYLDGDMIRLLRRNPEAEPLILRYVIHCQLHQSILNDQIYFFGLDDQTENIIRAGAPRPYFPYPPSPPSNPRNSLLPPPSPPRCCPTSSTSSPNSMPNPQTLS